MRIKWNPEFDMNSLEFPRLMGDTEINCCVHCESTDCFHNFDGTCNLKRINIRSGGCVNFDNVRNHAPEGSFFADEK